MLGVSTRVLREPRRVEGHQPKHHHIQQQHPQLMVTLSTRMIIVIAIMRIIILIGTARLRGSTCSADWTVEPAAGQPHDGWGSCVCSASRGHRSCPPLQMDARSLA